MSDSKIVITDRDNLEELIRDVVRREMLRSAPDALREAMKAKWLHRDDVKDRYGVTDRQLQYLRDNEKVTYSQRGRRIWYLRKSVEDYFEGGRVEASDR